jgi:hypothetical protein
MCLKEKKTVSLAVARASPSTAAATSLAVPAIGQVAMWRPLVPANGQHHRVGGMMQWFVSHKARDRGCPPPRFPTPVHILSLSTSLPVAAASMRHCSAASSSTEVRRGRLIWRRFAVGMLTPVAPLPSVLNRRGATGTRYRTEICRASSPRLPHLQPPRWGGKGKCSDGFYFSAKRFFHDRGGGQLAPSATFPPLKII